ncbi:putative endonuclease [Serratia phage vB_SspM_LC53]|nr:putative endonuclease [Serratia phage vB_SspM_LC53]
MAKQFNFVYITKNLINGKKYIGKHSTNNLFDGYYGTGELIKKAVKKYGIENFETSIIKFFDSEDEAYAYEELIVDEELIANSLYYNIDLGGKGSMKGRKHSALSKERTSKALKGKKKPPRSQTHIDNHLKAMSLRRKPKIRKVRIQKRGKDHSLYGRTRPAEVIDKCKSSNRTHLIWSLYDELFSFWLDNDKPGWRRMERIAVENGYPKTAYDKIIKQFKQDLE